MLIFWLAGYLLLEGLCPEKECADGWHEAKRVFARFIMWPMHLGEFIRENVCGLHTSESHGETTGMNTCCSDVPPSKCGSSTPKSESAHGE